ncbi:Gfo/Idh/MocA family oxidoreductase [Embleya sp. NPDC008237]|uniref:Gfo/Idh/MocA family oxidoreductase n=1 Tax=Embleya sp. NPDC008237 TaxID=3363978 RepID=UPI0036E0022A
MSKHLPRLVLLLAAATVLFPFLALMSAALQPQSNLAPGLDFPSDPHWENFKTAWTTAGFGSLLKSSALIALGVVPIALVLATLAGYGLATMRIKAKGPLFALFMVGMALPYEAIVIPLYYDLRSLGLLNSYWAVILPLIGLFMPFGVFWMRAHFESLPRELTEAAAVDGAGSWRTLTRVLLPTARPAARIAAAEGLAALVAVADPDPARRGALAAEFGIPDDRVFADWRDLAALPRLADAVIVATPDRLHADPAVAFADLGYALLLEKPMAPTEHEARRIVDAAVRNDVLFAVCHVLRYTPYSVTLKRLIDTGRIGDVVSVEHLEPVGWWHQAHSYVRGQWAVEAESSSMLLAKSCHDIDWLGHLVGRPVARVSSFGGLHHFRTENKPAGAGDRCVTCPVERTAPTPRPASTSASSATRFTSSGRSAC